MEILSNKFNSLLTQYQNTYQDFLNTINSNSNTLTTVPNSSFVGKNNINTIQNSSISNCLSSCNSNTSCSGATFDDNLNTCTLSNGAGNIISSTDKTAIVKQALYYSNQLKEINNELLSINNTMMQNATSNMNNYSQTQQLNSEKAKILKSNYNMLEQEREEIVEMIRQYETLNSAYENGNINVTSNYYLFMVYLLVAIFFVLLFFRINLSTNQTGGGHVKVSPLLLFFLAVVIIVNAYFKK